MRTSTPMCLVLIATGISTVLAIYVKEPRDDGPLTVERITMAASDAFTTKTVTTVGEGPNPTTYKESYIELVSKLTPGSGEFTIFTDASGYPSLLIYEDMASSTPSTSKVSVQTTTSVVDMNEPSSTDHISTSIPKTSATVSSLSSVTTEEDLSTTESLISHSHTLPSSTTSSTTVSSTESTSESILSISTTDAFSSSDILATSTLSASTSSTSTASAGNLAIPRIFTLPGYMLKIFTSFSIFNCLPAVSASNEEGSLMDTRIANVSVGVNITIAGHECDGTVSASEKPHLDCSHKSSAARSLLPIRFPSVLASILLSQTRSVQAQQPNITIPDIAVVAAHHEKRSSTASKHRKICHLKDMQPKCDDVSYCRWNNSNTNGSSGQCVVGAKSGSNARLTPPRIFSIVNWILLSPRSALAQQPNITIRDNEMVLQRSPRGNLNQGIICPARYNETYCTEITYCRWDNQTGETTGVHYSHVINSGRSLGPPRLFTFIAPMFLSPRSTRAQLPKSMKGDVAVANTQHEKCIPSYIDTPSYIEELKLLCSQRYEVYPCIGSNFCAWAGNNETESAEQGHCVYMPRADACPENSVRRGSNIPHLFILMMVITLPSLLFRLPTGGKARIRSRIVADACAASSTKELCVQEGAGELTVSRHFGDSADCMATKNIIVDLDIGGGRQSSTEHV